MVVGGEKIPLDGKIIKGNAEVSSAHINGEELPKILGVGSEVVGGSLVLNGEIVVESLKDSNEFFVYEMLDLLELSQTQKPPIGKMADKIASIFVPSIVVLSVVAFFFWWMMGEGFAFSLSIAAAILVVSCPCALGLAVPLAIVCASMRAKKSEILIKTPEVYERAREIKTIVFDKTGTLTKGEISIKNAEFISHDSNLIVSLCYAMQENNPHPIAKAFVEYLKAKKERIVLEEKEYIIAKGVRAKYANDEYFLGSLEWIETIIDKKITQNRENVIAFSNKSEILALFYLQDSIKEGAREMVESLQNIGIESVILSGDNVESVKRLLKISGLQNIMQE